MQTAHKLAMLFLLVGTLGLPATMPFANAQLQVPGRVNIIAGAPTTCGLEVIPGAFGTTLDYGDLAFAQLSPERTLTLNNTGTSAGVVDVGGSDWNTAAGGKLMPVTTTHYSLTQGTPYDASTALGSFGSFATIDASASLDSYWMLKADLDIPSYEGPASQTVTFSSFC